VTPRSSSLRTRTHSRPPRDRPIEACVVLLPLYELLQRNIAFRAVFAAAVMSDADDTPGRAPLPHTLMSVASYLVSHATSLSSARASAYAALVLQILLAISEKRELLRVLREPSKADVVLCGQVRALFYTACAAVTLFVQRLPRLPAAPLKRPLLCALLDCCVLCLRHNIHKQLDVGLYL
jgi:hypothetical protein